MDANPELRPGQLALLRDGRVTPLAITATLVDLAVRGFLRIEEVPAPPGRRRRGGGGSKDWLLVKVRPRPTERLLGYEQVLLYTTFGGRERVTMDELRDISLRVVRDQLMSNAISRGWFPGEPVGSIRRRIGSALSILGFAAAALALLSDLHQYFLLGLAASLVGGLVSGARRGRRRARRTPAGDAALARADGFCEELVTVLTGPVPGGSRSEIFGRWLSYAMVLGLADGWISRFRPRSGSDDDGDSISWYAACGGAGLADLGAGLTAFSDTASCTVESSSSWSSSSGFDGSGSSDSGGGGGGGGGGGSD
jgi:hypothetical protein